MAKFSEKLRGLSTESRGQGDFNARMAMVHLERQLREEMGPFIEKLINDKFTQIRVRDGRDGRNGIDGSDGADGSPDKPEEVRDKLQSLDGEERLDASAIKNLPRLIETVGRGKAGGGGSTLRVDNLSSQANGTTRTFTTTRRIGTAHALFYSGFPSVLLPTTDYTAAGLTVTIANAVNPPVAGQSLLFIYEDG